MATPQLSDAASVQRCWDSYWAPNNFDRVFSGSAHDDVWLGIKYFPSQQLVTLTFRGSTILMDWLRDATAQMYEDDALGGVPIGAMQGLRELLDTVRPMLQKDWLIVVDGHSLGAWRMNLFAALLELEGYRVQRCGFGSPRPGGKQLASILHRHRGILYKNRDDIVTAAPPVIRLIDEYVFPDAEIYQLDVKFDLALTQPNGADWVDYPERAQDHHVGLYKEGVNLCFATSR